MNEEQALLAAVLDDYDDDLPRLALADFWEEHGQSERAEFVRVQCAIAESPHDQPCYCFNYSRGACSGCGHNARLAALRRRQGELLNGQGKYLEPGSWSWPIWQWAASWDWRRGFIGSVRCTAESWLEHGDAILAAQPVEEVTLTTCPRLFSTADNWRREVRYWFRPEEADDDEKVFRVSMRLRAAEKPSEQDTLLFALRTRWSRVRHWHLPPATTTHGPATVSVAGGPPMRDRAWSVTPPA